MTGRPPIHALPPEALRRTLDPASLAFESTADVAPLAGLVHQPRAAAALDLALDMDGLGYNLFVTGPPGTARLASLEAELRRRAAEQPTPPDLIYVFDFDAPTRPAVVALPPGRGPDFARDVETLVKEAQRAIRAAFESQSYRERHRSAHAPFEAARDELLARLQAAGRERDVELEITPAGVVSVPVVDGKPVEPAEFEHLAPAERSRYQQAVHDLEAVVADTFGRLQQAEREEVRAHRRLDREIAVFATGHLFEEAKRAWSGVERLGDWLDALHEDLIDRLETLRAGRGPSPNGRPPEPMTAATPARHVVHVLVSHQPGSGAPVVTARDCSTYDIFGRIDYETAYGAATTDHRHLRAGAVHRAAGGYLLLKADEVLAKPFAWSRLKEVLRTGKARIENLGTEYMLFPSASLDPEPVTVDLTVVLVGTPQLHRLLYALDDDVRRLFKVRADFDDRTAWDPAAVDDYAAFVSRQVRDDGLRHFDRGAVARLVEHGARLAGHRERLSIRFDELGEIVAEAGHRAARDEAPLVTAEHVERALADRRHRADLPEERWREELLEGTLRIEVTGAAVGQVNGLAVAELGDHRFGHPVRVTATAGPGGGKVVDIDREAELSGPIHDKGFMILAGLLRDRYGADQRLALQASIVFEQSYGPVEGDSASLAELLALLSALARLPLSQELAVTGSVDQHGRVQAVGGVDEKIEGFFALCRARGLTGHQGVLIPAANVPHLMLDSEVVEAVRDGRFAIWPVADVDDAVQLLTGDADAFVAQIEARVDAFAELAREGADAAR